MSKGSKFQDSKIKKGKWVLELELSLDEYCPLVTALIKEFLSSLTYPDKNSY